MSEIETKKISELTSLSEIPSDLDEVAIRDISASLTKKHPIGYTRRSNYTEVIASGSLALSANHYVELNLGSAIALTISSAPVVGDMVEIYRVGSGGVTHTVQLPSGVTWDGTNRTANFNGDADRIRARAISATRFRVLENDSVTFTA